MQFLVQTEEVAESPRDRELPSLEAGQVGAGGDAVGQVRRDSLANLEGINFVLLLTKECFIKLLTLAGSDTRTSTKNLSRSSSSSSSGVDSSTEDEV